MTVDGKGVITIPSAACSIPTESTRPPDRNIYKDPIVFVKYKDEDTRLHDLRYSTAADSFEGTFDAPESGSARLGICCSNSGEENWMNR